MKKIDLKKALILLFALSTTMIISAQNKDKKEKKKDTTGAVINYRLLLPIEPPPDDGGGYIYSWYRDADADGYGNPNILFGSETKPVGYVSNNSDCNDSNSNIHPGATEILDSLDNDCDGVIDEGLIINGPILVKIVGDLAVNINDITTTSVLFKIGEFVESFNWTVTGGVIQSQTMDSVTIKWTTIGSGTITYDGSNGLQEYFGNRTITISGTVVNPPPSTSDEDMNWITSKAFDITGATIASSKSYFDDLGKGIQSQSIDIKTGRTWASQTLYDSQGRPALQTLSAPTYESGGFMFNSNFIKNSSGNNYQITDFEGGSKTVEPSPIGNTLLGTLGWYYSDKNKDEFYVDYENPELYKGNKYQDITDYPFSRTIYSDLNPGAVRKVIGGNKINNEWKSGNTFSMPAGQELAQSVAFGDAKYNGYKIVKTISKDVRGFENVVFSDTDGKVLASARVGGTPKSYNNTISIGQQGYVDIHVPSKTTGFTISKPAGITLQVFDLITEQPDTRTTATLPEGFYRVSITNLENYNPNPNITSTQVQVICKDNYYDYSLNEYNKAGQLIASYQPNGETKATKPVSTFTYNALGQLLSTTSPDEGTANFKYRNDGQIRYSQNSKQLLASPQEFSYTDYDNLGRPDESGVIESSEFSSSHPDYELPIGIKKEQQITRYDALEQTDLTYLTTLNSDYHNPTFLAGNVAKTSNDNTATYYSYDIYGRVKWIVQDITGLGTKTIDYEYDPVTSAVTKVDFQRYKTDERFIHQYTYNTVNELVKVETSTNNINFITHAEYSYYETGALKRVNLAEGLQGIDYVYNINGQLKSINHPSLDPGKDPGGDANDLFGMAIDYHKDDYKRPLTDVESTIFGEDQYNGNIKAVRWNSDYNKLTNAQNTYSYGYNNNNWLKSANYGEYNSNGFIPNSTGDYGVTGIMYDANGNIKELNRNKNTDVNGNAMDNFKYHYKNDKPNQLDRVEDTAPAITGADDLKNQPNSNYFYNAIGQLVADLENVTDIVERENYKTSGIEPTNIIKYKYNASGLVTEVSKKDIPLVKFFYNDKGMRVRKEAYSEINGSLTNTEYYVRDGAGNVLAIYSGTAQKELPIYGASRLGVFYKGETSIADKSVYQLTDHLGNVRAVIAKEGNSAVASTATDYYPFGMPMPGRQIVGGELYRYAFQGQEKDPETGKEAFQLRLWDGRIGRWLTTDPYGQYFSPYVGMGNDPINGIDPDGGWETKWGRFWGWVGNGFKGSFIGDGTASDTNKNFGLQFVETSSFTEIDGGFQQEIRLHSAYSGADIASYNHEFESPVLPPANFFERLTGRTIDVGDQLTLPYTVDKYGYLDGVQLRSGLGLMDYQSGKGFLKLGKEASKLAVKLFKYGKVGKVPLPKLNPNQFKTVGGETVHINSGAIYRKSYTQHTGKHGEWKIFTKGTTNFGKQAKTTGNRITTDLQGNIINN